MSDSIVLTVTSAASSTNVVDIADLKTELGISGSGEDASLNRVIAAVGAAFASDRGLGFNPWRQTYSEKLPGSGRPFLFLSQRPIESVTSVARDGGTLATTEYQIAGKHRDRLHRLTGSWSREEYSHPGITPGPMAGTATPDWTVAYVAGWVMPDETPGGVQIAFPGDLELAALQQAASWYEEPMGETGTVESERIEGLSVKYANREKSSRRMFLPEVEEVLLAYR